MNILSAKCIFEKSAERILSRHQDTVDEYKAMETRTLRDGSKSITGLGDNTALRRDFFTVLYLATWDGKGDTSKERVAVKKFPLNNLQLTKWCIKQRKRVALLIRRKKARNANRRRPVF